MVPHKFPVLHGNCMYNVLYLLLLLQGGHSPLSIAAYSNRIEVVKLLLSSGADVDAVDEVIEILMIIVYVSY